ncbi:MAG: FapA family protein [Planctomycetes bacterium]|nr:FapA family protein [Planctomycetota bacterium]
MTSVYDLQNDPTDVELAGHNGEPVPMCTLYYDRTSEFEVRIVSSPDRMRVYIQMLPGPNFVPPGPSRIRNLLELAGIAAGFLDSGIVLYSSLMHGTEPYTGFFQVARGEPMRKGEDGSIEFHVQPTAFKPRYDEEDDGAIDFKQLNLIENCFAGQRVASILPPGPGRPGTDIFGDEIPPMPGNPISVQAGPGVVISSNGRDFTSEIEGRVVYENDVISVSPVLEIYRDIDYSVGNVDFVGKVVVNGSLLDGFYINAKHGVELTGEMGASRITSEGDVKLTGGVKGKNVAFISCRNLTARYIDDAVVEASGDVVVNKEIMNSNIKSLGRLSIPDGAIIGGEVCGYHGVEAQSLGSDMGVATRVISGLNWTDEEQLQGMRSRIAELLDRTQSAKLILDPLLADREILSQLGEDQKSMLSELIAELRELRDQLAELLDSRSRITNRRQTGLVNQVNVTGTMHMGVSIRFTLVESPIKDDITGPLSVTQDEKNKSIRIGSFVKLPTVHEDGTVGTKRIERDG